MRLCLAFCPFFATQFISQIIHMIQEHKLMLDSIDHMTSRLEVKERHAIKSINY